MRAFITRRKGSVTGLVLGVVAVVLVGTVLAIVTDSISITDNDASSAPYDSPSPKLALARKPTGQSCAALTYSGEDSTALFSHTLQPVIDWAKPGLQQLDGQMVCLKNVGTAPGRVSVSIPQIADTEIDACTESEAFAGDETCESGARGELSGYLGSIVWGQGGTGSGGPSTSASCTGDTGIVPFVPTFGSSGGPVGIDASLAPGETCAIQISLLAQGDAARYPGMPVVTEQDKLVTQTDQVSFDIVFDLASE